MPDNDSKSIPKMRHEVIDNTIRIELLLDMIIQIDLGFEEELIPNGRNGIEISNLKKIEKFKEQVLKKFRLPSKFNYLKYAASFSNKKLPKNYWKIFERFIKIRNIFAHTLAPKYPLYKPGTIGILSSDYEKHSKEIEEWEKLYKEHLILYDKINKIIEKFFIEKLKLMVFKGLGRGFGED